MESLKAPYIVVLGSASGDVFFKVDRLPTLGETLDARGVEKSLGGKGANQAVTCGKLGANVQILLQLGNDEIGHSYVQNLKENNVNTDNVKLLDGIETG